MFFSRSDISETVISLNSPEQLLRALSRIKSMKPGYWWIWFPVNFEFYISKAQLIKRQICHHIETSQLIYPANQLTGFYMMTTLAFNGLTLLEI